MHAEKPSASITLSLGETQLRQLPLGKERISIGRRLHNDVVLDHPTVSAEHAAIVTIGNDSFLEDLNSTNGTLVNGQRVKKHFLQNGDLIELAAYTLRYRAAPRTGATAAGAVRCGTVRVLNGPNAGRELALSKPLTSLGRPGVQVAVILNLPEGYCLRHIEGEAMPMVNGKSVGASLTPLASGDVIDLSGTHMLFVLA